MQKPRVIIDRRERNLDIITGLEKHDIEMTFAQLPVGDYIISDRICIERKTMPDLENSIIDSRLFDQVARLHASFSKPILLIEGDESALRLNRNVILGTIARLYIDYNIQVVRTLSPADTAYSIYRLADHEQSEDRQPRLMGLKKAHTNYQWQVLILSSIPGIGTKLAQKLIERFKTIRGVVSADIEDLEGVDKIGKKKAQRIYEILNAEFEGANR